MPKIFLLSIYFLGLTGPCIGQTGATMPAISAQIDQYNREYPRFTLHLIFNQPTYVPGDTAYFAAYLRTDDGVKVKGRHAAQIHLTDEHGNAAGNWFFRIENGKASGQVVVPNETRPGLYHFIAFTDWMRNFDPDFYAYCPAFIAAPKNYKTVAKDDNQVSFFSEGGNLIPDVSNRLVVKTGKKWRTREMVVRDREGKVLAKAPINSSGFGSFYLNPTQNQEYYGEIDDNKWPLPGANPAAISLLVTQTKDNQMRIVVSAPKQSAVRQKNLYLFFLSGSKIVTSSQVQLADQEFAGVVFPAHQLPPGIIQLAVFDDRMEVIAKRFFHSTSQQAQTTADIYGIKNAYGQREKVTAEIKIADQSGASPPGDFTFRVVNEGLFDNEVPDPLRATLEHTFGVSTKSFTCLPDWKSSLDLFLITQQKSWLDWNKVRRIESQPKHLMSQFYHWRGRLEVASGFEKVKMDSILLTIFLPKQLMSYEVHTDSTGAFDALFLFDFYEQEEAIVLATQRERPVRAFSIRDEVIPLSVAPVASLTTDSDNPYEKYSTHLDLIRKAFRVKPGKELPVQQEENLHALFESTFKDDFKYIHLQDYVIFPTMEEVVREIIPILYHRRRGTEERVRVHLVKPPVNFVAGDPLFVIDGRMTKDASAFLSLKPKEVLDIGVINEFDKLQKLGPVAHNGIVLVTTTRPAQSKSLVNDGFMIKGFEKASAFPARDYSGGPLNTLTPDFRPTLHWVPTLNRTEEGKFVTSFYSPDDTGRMAAILEGFTDQGDYVFNKMDFDILIRQ